MYRLEGVQRPKNLYCRFFSRHRLPQKGTVAAHTGIKLWVLFITMLFPENGGGSPGRYRACGAVSDALLVGSLALRPVLGFVRRD